MSSGIRRAGAWVTRVAPHGQLITNTYIFPAHTATVIAPHRDMATTHRLSKTDFEALADFRYELRRFLRFSEDAAKSAGLRPLQYQLLLQIKGLRRPALPTVGDLATRLQMAQHGMVTLITRSEKAGLVVRVPGKKDRRVVCVKLTAQGERAVQRVAQLNIPELRSVSKVLRLPRLSVGSAT